jgi:WXXGXW repeat (2 copies)
MSRSTARLIPTRKTPAVLACTIGLVWPALAQYPPPPPGPPPLRYEAVPPPRPGAYVWEPGHWHWNGVQYVWVEGRYVPRHPHRPYAQYTPGRWVWNGGAWVWQPSHWR